MTPVEIGKMKSTYFVAKGGVGPSCDLDSSPEGVPRQNLSHLFRNWDTKLTAHE